MKGSASRSGELFVVGLTFVAGVVALVLGLVPQGELTGAARAAHVGYGILFMAGAVTFLARPRLGSAVLIVGLLSCPAVAFALGFPEWEGGSWAARAGLVLGAISAAGMVSGPLLARGGGRRA